MEWIKIFPSEAVARANIQEHLPQLIIVGGERICLALHEGKFFAVQDKCTHNGESLSKGQINIKEKSFALFMDLDLILMAGWHVTLKVVI